jgi:glutamate/tyrosine decarboxylase-like PLP-dependent enzyme
MQAETSADISEVTLDPIDWTELRIQSHQMMDDMLNHIEGIRTRPVWQPIPQKVRNSVCENIPVYPTGLPEVHKMFMESILPFSAANIHPGFMGWVQGGGTPVGMLAEMLAAGLNANVGGRDQMPVEIEKQVTKWVCELFNFPETASGLFVTGTSIANLISIIVARTAALGAGVRQTGLATSDKRLIAYTSTGAHGCIAQAMDLSGLGTHALRLIPMNNNFQMDCKALQLAIIDDRKSGLTPFFIAATAGTVDVGAIDNLEAIAEIAQKENLWFHIDGAYGALAILAPDIAPRLAGIQRADSIAFDFHKWGQVPYDAGFILIRNGNLHLDTFAAPSTYLRRESRGMSAGSPWPCDFGPDLSRGFRALKTWFTIKVYGTDKIGSIISNTCKLAQYLKKSIEDHPCLELLSPVSLNIVCFRFRCENSDIVNSNIVVSLQEAGIVAPSTTQINGSLAIRVAIVNHRTSTKEIDALIKATIEFGEIYLNENLI